MQQSDNKAYTDNSMIPEPDYSFELFDLAAGLWLHKWFAVATAAIFVLMGVGYITFATATYKASAHVRPAGAADLLIVNRKGLLEISPSEAFQQVLYEMESPATRAAVLRTADLEYPEVQSDLLLLWSLTPPSSKKGELNTKDYFAVAAKNTDPVKAAKMVNALVEAANKNVVSGLVAEFQASLRFKVLELEQRIQLMIELEDQANQDSITRLDESDRLQIMKLEDELKALRNTSLQLRMDKIKILEEALGIARSLGIDDPVTFGGLEQLNPTYSSLAIRADFGTQEEPQYLRGTKVLTAEIEALKNRDTDDFAVEKIRVLEQKIALLRRNRTIEVLRERKDNTPYAKDIQLLRAELGTLLHYENQDYSSVKAVKLDQPAAVPEDPVNPDKKLVLALCTVGGVFLGILVSLIAFVFGNRRPVR